MVAIMGDLVGAFPKTWRELVVVLVRLEAGVRGSRLVLLKEFLRYTTVEVSYSGTSTVQTHSGLPEGGMLGPLCYPLLPMMLDRCLAAAGAGISADAGSATQADLSGFNALDPGSTTALGQIDAAARLRLRILLIADDQIMPASSILVCKPLLIWQASGPPTRPAVPCGQARKKLPCYR